MVGRGIIESLRVVMDTEDNMQEKDINIKILVAHHKKAPFFKNRYVIPIQVGKALKDFSLKYCIADDTGDNISAKNRNWCELTAIYWAWKNLKADYYGLCHYRRYISFEENSDYNVITSFDDNYFQKQLSEENIRAMCSKYDIITGPVWDIHPVGIDKRMSSYNFYRREHVIHDLDVTINVIKEQFPDYYYAAMDSLTSEYCFFMNLVAMRKELFYKYCEFMFGVLEEVEKRISVEGRDSYQSRVFGFLAERLSNVFVNYIVKEHPEVRIKNSGMFFLAETNVIDKNLIMKQLAAKRKLLPAAQKINICMSFDDNYLAPGLTTIASILDRTSTPVHFYFLCDERLSTHSRKLIVDNVGGRNEADFLDINPQVLSYFPLNREYISINTYYRLLIHQFIHEDKVIYMDSDVIVCDDILKLWNFDLGDNLVGGALDEGGVVQCRRLGLPPKSNYFNAGITVFNLKEIRARIADPMKLYLDTFYKYRECITLQDQDILNLAFDGHICTLPLKWNVNGRIFEPNELDHKYSQQDIDEALGDLGIIHYTDRKKPWKVQATHPLTNLYWFYRNKVKGLDLSNAERRVIFMQKHFKYKKSGRDLVVEFHGYDFRVNKERLKRIMQKLNFKF